MTPLVLAGCQGRLGDGTHLGAAGGAPVGEGWAPGPSLGECERQAPDVEATGLRRLSRLEYQLTLMELFGLEEPPDVSDVPTDAAQAGFETFVERQLVSANHLDAYVRIAGRLFDASVGVEPTAFVGCDASTATCLGDYIGRFGRLAFRRTLDASEVERVAVSAVNATDDSLDRVRFATQVLLSSPTFLYRSEGVGAGMQTLTGVELATRLSFALWGQAPSVALLDEAEEGVLDTQQGLARTVDQMVRDDRTERFLTYFFEQWLGYSRLQPPSGVHDGWSEPLLDDMKEETRRTLVRYAFEEGANVFESLTIDETWVTPRLADYYGFPEVLEDGWIAVPSRRDRSGAGIVGHGSMTGARQPGEPISQRGNLLRSIFLCQELHLPPDLSDVIAETSAGLSPIEVVAKRNEEAACAGCHGLIDPIGIALGGFDETGRWDSAYDADVYGIAPGFPGSPDPMADTPGAIASALRAMPELGECVAERLFLFVHGREPGVRDQCAVVQAHERFVQSGHSFPALVTALLTSPSIRLRQPLE